MTDEKLKDSLQKNNQEANQWAMFVHFALLAGFVVPLVGIVLPIIIWQIKKDQYPIVDIHGKIVANWIISAMIYFVISLLLAVLIVGIVGIVAVMLLTVIYSIIGGIKANNGEVWEYPLSLKLIK